MPVVVTEANPLVHPIVDPLVAGLGTCMAWLPVRTVPGAVVVLQVSVTAVHPVGGVAAVPSNPIFCACTSGRRIFEINKKER